MCVCRIEEEERRLKQEKELVMTHLRQGPTPTNIGKQNWLSIYPINKYNNYVLMYSCYNYVWFIYRSATPC